MKFIEVAVSEVQSVLINFAQVAVVEQTLTGSRLVFANGSQLEVIHNTQDLIAKLLAQHPDA